MGEEQVQRLRGFVPVGLLGGRRRLNSPVGLAGVGDAEHRVTVRVLGIRLESQTAGFVRLKPANQPANLSRNVRRSASLELSQPGGCQDRPTRPLSRSVAACRGGLVDHRIVDASMLTQIHRLFRKGLRASDGECPRLARGIVTLHAGGGQTPSTELTDPAQRQMAVQRSGTASGSPSVMNWTSSHAFAFDVERTETAAQPDGMV